MASEQIPLKKRPVDIALIVFFIINFIFITYMIDIEQLVIADANNFQYPAWPPRWLVDLVHWYGKNFDPVLMARPAWWRATIWIDSLFFGPFYLIAIYAFVKGRNLETLVNDESSAGLSSTAFDGKNYASGLYFYRMFIDGKVYQTQKLYY